LPVQLKRMTEAPSATRIIELDDQVVILAGIALTATEIRSAAERALTRRQLRELDRELYPGVPPKAVLLGMLFGGTAVMLGLGVALTLAWTSFGRPEPRRQPKDSHVAAAAPSTRRATTTVPPTTVPPTSTTEEQASGFAAASTQLPATTTTIKAQGKGPLDLGPPGLIKPPPTRPTKPPCVTVTLLVTTTVCIEQ